MTNILECKDVNELISMGWSYPKSTNSSVISPVTGKYCWKRYTLSSDGTKKFQNFVVSDNEIDYPENDSQDGYYYEPISQEELAQLMANTEAGSFPVSSINNITQLDADTVSVQISI